MDISSRGLVLPCVGKRVARCTWLLLILCMVFVGVASASADETAFSVRIEVIDQQTGQPIEKFRVVPASFEGQNRVVTWQSPYAQDLGGPEGLFEMQRGWNQTILRIDAEGYRPVVSDPLPGEGHQTLKIRLIPNRGIAGVILQPDGSLATEAEIALCTRTNEIMVEKGHLRATGHGLKLRPIERSNQKGEFQLSAECDTWVLVISHDSGYREITQQEFEESSKIVLQPWGRIEGEFVTGYQPQVGTTIRIGSGRGDVDVNLHYSGDTQTNDQGEFVFERIPPTLLVLYPMFELEGVPRNVMWVSTQVSVKSGEATRLIMPRVGKSLTGTVRLSEGSRLNPADLEFSVSMILRNPPISGFQDDVRTDYKVYHEFLNTELGKLYQRKEIRVEPDGRFSVEGLPECQYILHVTAHRKDSSESTEKPRIVASYTTRLTVESLEFDKTTQDLGIIELKDHPDNKSSDVKKSPE